MPAMDFKEDDVKGLMIHHDDGGAEQVDDEVRDNDVPLRDNAAMGKRFSKPFLDNDEWGVGCVYIDDDPDLPGAGNFEYQERCQLCDFYDGFEADLPKNPSDGDTWGVLYTNVQHAALAQSGKAQIDQIPHQCCEEQHQDDIHAYHVRCLRGYVLMHRTKFEKEPRCPIDAGWIREIHAPVISESESSYWESDEEPIDLRFDDGVKFIEAGVTGAKKQKHKTSQIYQVVVHIIEAKELRIPGSDAAPKPVVSVTSDKFSTNFKTSHTGNATFSKVWDTPVPFQKKMTEEEFNDAMIEIELHSHNAWWLDTLIGKVQLQAKVVNQQPNHEYYRRWENVISSTGDFVGKIQYSVVIFSEKDFEKNPYLPIHVYDLEVAMWDEIIAEGTGDVGTLDDLDDPAFLDNAIANQSDVKREMHAVQFKFYRAQYIPKMGTFGWTDSYIEIDNKIARRPDWDGKSLVTPVQRGEKHPEFNTQLAYTIYTMDPTVADVRLLIKSKNAILRDDVIGTVKIDLRHMIATYMQNGGKSQASGLIGPIWKNVYTDIDGQAPIFCGQIYFSIQIKEDIAERVWGMTPLPAEVCPQPTYSPCKLEIEMYEGVHLYGNDETYHIDVTMGHNLSREGRQQNGMVWETFQASAPDETYYGVNHISTKRTVYFDGPAADGKVVDEWSKGVHPMLRATRVEDGIDESRKIFKQNNTIPTDGRSFFPDIIIYVTKGRQPRDYKPQKDDCIGYFRIPVNGMVRATEARQESKTCGADLTIFHDLWLDDVPVQQDDNGVDLPPPETGRCLQLKEVVELYEGTPGFLAFKLKMSWLSEEEEDERLDAEERNEPMEEVVEEPLMPLKRIKYNFATNFMQANNIAGDPDTGLSNCFVTCSLMNLTVTSRTMMKSNYPMWFEHRRNWSNKVKMIDNGDVKIRIMDENDDDDEKNDGLELKRRESNASTVHGSDDDNDDDDDDGVKAHGELEAMKEEVLTELYLPEQSCYIPDVKYLLYHKDYDDKSFRGKVEIPADFSGFGEGDEAEREFSPLRWYPIMHEDLPCGELLVSFFLCPESEMPGTPSDPFDPKANIPKDDDWEMWHVDVVGLALRGAIGQDFARRGVAPMYELDAGFGQVQTVHQRDADKKLNIKVRKHTDPIFFTCVQCRAYDGNDLHAITTIPATIILKSRVGWYKVLDKYMTTPDNAARNVFRKWKKFLPLSAQNLATVDDDWGDEDDQFDEDDPEAAAAAAKSAAGTAKKLAAKSRTFDENGDADFDAEQMEEIELPPMEKKMRLTEHPYFRHWRVQTSYEQLPMVRNPFEEFNLNPARTDFLDGLVIPSREVIGTLRGNFHPTQMTTVGTRKLAPPPSNSFDRALYQESAPFAVRVYVCQARQLLLEGGNQSGGKVYLTVQVGHADEQRADPEKESEGSMNPKFYKRVDFYNIMFPDPFTILTINVYLTKPSMFTMFGEPEPQLIGSTQVSLENRLYNKDWQTGRRPLEYRPLFHPNRGHMPQGKLEVCLDVIPQEHAGLPGPPAPKWPLDYLLDPPQREPWQLRVTIYQSRGVPNKEINIPPDASCCTKICSLPNHSHLWVFSMMMGNDDVLCRTDTHKYAYDGDAIFNSRHLHEIKLPSPKPHATLKLSIWHDQGFFSLNDDCLCEVVIPLWEFFEIGRRSYEDFRAQDGKMEMGEGRGVFKLGRRWVKLSHPHNDNTGELEIELELVPCDLLSEVPELVVAGDDGKGADPTPEKAWDPNLNPPQYLLEDPRPKRPDEANIPWYRYDLKCLFRAKFICKNLLPWLILLALLAIGCGILYFMVITGEFNDDD